MVPATHVAGVRSSGSGACVSPAARHDARDLRNALGKFATGVCVITTRGPDGKLEGLTANSFCSVSLDPPIVLWSLRQDAGSLPTFERATHFGINILHARQLDMSRHFCSPALDKFQGWADEFIDGLEGVPILRDALATFECEQVERHRVGDHIVFYGAVKRYAYSQASPLAFHAGSYTTIGPLRD